MLQVSLKIRLKVTVLLIPHSVATVAIVYSGCSNNNRAPNSTRLELIQTEVLEASEYLPIILPKRFLSTPMRRIRSSRPSPGLRKRRSRVTWVSISTKRRRSSSSGSSSSSEGTSPRSCTERNSSMAATTSGDVSGSPLTTARRQASRLLSTWRSSTLRRRI